ncbi:hypothetical protein HDV03_003931 [Kappamyces sp. JEL0829]|nr:hypothetical protein HDV03_003931 [Kappamyces sp. JEL0829]
MSFLGHFVKKAKKYVKKLFKKARKFQVALVSLLLNSGSALFRKHLEAGRASQRGPGYAVDSGADRTGDAASAARPGLSRLSIQQMRRHSLTRGMPSGRKSCSDSVISMAVSPLEPASDWHSLNPVDFLTLLPRELALYILSLSLQDTRSWKALSQVSRSWNQLSRDPIVFRSLYGTMYPDAAPNQALGPLGLDWKVLLLERMRLSANWKQGAAKKTFFQAHDDAIYCIALQNGSIFTGSRDRTVKIWNSLDQSLEGTLVGHLGSVLCLTLSRCGLYIVTGSSDRTVKVWSRASYICRLTLAGHLAPILDVQTTDTHIYSCSKDKSIRKWDLRTGQPVKTIFPHKASINSIHIQGNLLVSGCGDGSATLFDLDSLQVLKTFKSFQGGIACIKLDGPRILAGLTCMTCLVWSLDGGYVFSLDGHSDLVRTLDTSLEWVVTGSYDQTIKVYSKKEEWELILDQQGEHASWVFGVACSPTLLVSACQDGMVGLYDFGSSIGENSAWFAKHGFLNS